MFLTTILKVDMRGGTSVYSFYTIKNTLILVVAQLLYWFLYSKNSKYTFTTY